MQRVILLTEEEYNQIKSESPSSILQATLTNLKTTNDKLTTQVYELQKELANYKLVSSTKSENPFSTRGFSTKDLVNEYNSLSKTTKAIKPILSSMAVTFNTSVQDIKTYLKDAIATGYISRDTKANTYTIVK